MKGILFLTGALFLFSGLVSAASQGTTHTIDLPSVSTELKAGEGKDKTASFCSICHSLDYITMQPKFPRAQWTATVNKMIKVMGAPIPEDDARTIIQYLTVQYGREN
ncbi:MAG TPA: hypothetical protein VEI96_05095 [Thermodesulfovibrionales bacterium]|nr:hypothetical protein [Thermodesulfovibrionales bacterium]